MRVRGLRYEVIEDVQGRVDRYGSEIKKRRKRKRRRRGINSV